MERVNRDIIVPYMEAYKRYLSNLKGGGSDSNRPLSNAEEDYKRGIAARAREIIDSRNWGETDIGDGVITLHVIKAVQRNINIVGRFQVTAFLDKAKEEYSISDRIFYDLYHEHKEQECFEMICKRFGRKYDLVSYLYFIADPSRFLPLRSSIFDSIFKKLKINLQTSGHCSWDNYQEYLAAVGTIRDIMKEYYQIDDVDLLDAHSFLWTLRSDVLTDGKPGVEAVTVDMKDEKGDTGIVYHKKYGKGTIIIITDESIYVNFSCGLRIFPYPEAFEKEYLGQ